MKYRTHDEIQKALDITQDIRAAWRAGKSKADLLVMFKEAGGVVRVTLTRTTVSFAGYTARSNGSAKQALGNWLLQLSAEERFLNTVRARRPAGEARP